MPEPRRDQSAPPSPPQVEDRKVIVLNSSPHLRTIDFGADAATGVRGKVSIPAAKIGGFRDITPGELEMAASTWKAICEHPTAKHLVRKGTLSVKGLAGGA